jgi:hypothetical protein
MKINSIWCFNQCKWSVQCEAATLAGKHVKCIFLEILKLSQITVWIVIIFVPKKIVALRDETLNS